MNYYEMGRVVGMIKLAQNGSIAPGSTPPAPPVQPPAPVPMQAAPLWQRAINSPYAAASGVGTVRNAVNYFRGHSTAPSITPAMADMHRKAQEEIALNTARGRQNVPVGWGPRTPQPQQPSMLSRIGTAARGAAASGSGLAGLLTR